MVKGLRLDGAGRGAMMAKRESAAITRASAFDVPTAAKRCLRLAAALTLGLAAACQNGQRSPADKDARASIAVIPAPASVELLDGAFALARNARVHVVGDEKALRIAGYFADLMRRTAGFALTPEASTGPVPSDGVIFLLQEDLSLPPEGYRIEVAPERAAVTASTPEGLFYGAVTLWQLATPAEGAAARIPALTIEDAPGLEWRGAMLDSARHYQSPDFIKSFIDWMALHKLNVFHWHLTDDQAWRLEIKQYPKLTEVGAWRAPAGAAERDMDPATGRPHLYGGYYTQEDVRDIVAYAKERFVRIVPEIDMPGHAQAAIVAYPELGAGNDRPKAVSSDWGVFPYAYNVDDATFQFLENVLAETAALFPGAYIHVGGDEVVKDHWRADAGAQARLAELGLEDETELQGYFTRRIGAFLEGEGRRLVGWDEIIEGGLGDSAVVMSWRGVTGAIEAARQGHDAVLSPAPDLYFDNRQSGLPDEPPGRGNVIALESVYRFNPYPDGLTADQRAHVKGVQANIWTEHIRTAERVEHMTFPRLAALAEVAWAPAAEKDWPGFVRRLVPMLERYEALGVDYAKSAFTPRIRIGKAGGGARVRLDSQAGAGEIRYTLDGSAPDASSPLYDKDLTIEPPAVLTATTFIDGKAVASARADIDGRNHLRRKSQELQTCESNLVLNLEDDAPLQGERAVFLIDIMKPCWIFPQADLTDVSEIEADVGQVPFNFQIGEDIEKISFRPPRTPEGELDVRRDSCDGDIVASLPLAPAAGNPGVTTIRGDLAHLSGAHDLCFAFTSDGIDPMWAIDQVRLVPGR